MNRLGWQFQKPLNNLNIIERDKQTLRVPWFNARETSHHHLPRSILWGKKKIKTENKTQL